MGPEIGLVHRAAKSETTFIESTGTTHGTHVASSMLGYNYSAQNDAIAGYLLLPDLCQWDRIRQLGQGPVSGLP
ncbi:MAG: hypothetical protein H5T33_05640 [Candidatus Methanosuratus sp.]|nr:hypothetical protein [Candidatus Methanosuratincola sp.]